MAHIELVAQQRNLKGNDNRKLRRDGLIPAVLFSKEYGSDSIQVEYREFVKVYKKAGKTQVIELLIDGKNLPCIVNGIDVHPVQGVPRHVDFLSVDLKKKVIASVPVVIEGEAIGVKEQGAVLIVDLEEVEVEALPDKLPGEIVVNVTELKAVGEHIVVGQLPKSDDYQYVTEEDQVVATLVAQSKEEDFDSGVDETIIEGGEGGDEADSSGESQAGDTSSADQSENK